MVSSLARTCMACLNPAHTCLNRGLVATFQAFQKGLGPFLTTRLLLG